MVRAPCCEKMGMKKGPWTAEEDKILTDYIFHHGHGNWRQLPKLAGLLRCGKSCRLRWINYLKPDIKRGNFSREEEDTIIQMHELLGNRWSAIAARLPGRTDNEIKNVWHTHLKKRLAKTRTDDQTERSSSLKKASSDQRCSSSVSSVVTGDQNATNATALENNDENIDDFWSEVLSGENSGHDEELWGVFETGQRRQETVGCSEIFEETDFWYNLLARAELPELLEFSPQTIF